MIPRYLALFSKGIIKSFICIFIFFIFFCGRWNTTRLDFKSFKDSLFALSQLFTCLSSWFTISLMTCSSLCDRKLVSSAKRWNFNNFETLCISFMYIKNNNGPRTLPCGTPHFIVRVADLTSFILTSHLRSFKYDLNHSRGMLLMPKFSSFLIRMSWWTVLKCFCKVQENATDIFFFFKIIHNFWICLKWPSHIVQ